MILQLKPQISHSAVEKLKNAISERGLSFCEIEGLCDKALGIFGDVSKHRDFFRSLDIVESVTELETCYKLANRAVHPLDTVVTVGGQKIGGGVPAILAGPCTVENAEQIFAVAESVKAAGATFLRGGAFKARSSPYAFDGLGLRGLSLLKAAGERVGLPIVSEILSPAHLDVFARDVDVIQIGARNMQNFALLREVGGLKKPVLLKRGISATVDELLMAAEHILAVGCSDVILCERGIRTFETATRNTLDLSAIPVLKEKSHLPVLVDPSHGTGCRHLVPPLSLAAIAAGADGLLIEVHNAPDSALCDGPQSITPEEFHDLMQKINKVHAAIL